MSWLPNPFKSLGAVADDDQFTPDTVTGSFKEDLSEIGVTIGRQLRGVAEFLAPPPRPPSSPSLTDELSGDTRSPRLAGVRNDLAEIRGSLISLLSSNKISSDFTRREELGREVAEIADARGLGITDGVVDFVAEISHGPECWTDFPLPVNDDGFSMNQVQIEHVSAIEKLVPSLADLRIRLNSIMSERQFWMIYFVLLVPRLDENSLNLLSTPKVIEARNALLKKLQSQKNSLNPDSKKDHIEYSSRVDGKLDKNGHGTNTSSTDKPVSSENENEDTFSFSDLEGNDTDHSIRPHGPGRGHDAGSYSSDGSSDWVRLNTNEKIERGRSRKGQLSSRNRDSEGEESSDWLKVHDSDYFN